MLYFEKNQISSSICDFLLIYWEITTKLRRKLVEKHDIFEKMFFVAIKIKINLIFNYNFM